jgi:TolB-like protein/DNA-binding winged helix-turn-helix (wHTH) protein/Flp pilus assembly protein TadD
MVSSGSRQTFRFREFELDVAAYELRRDGRPVRLERHPLDLLILLVERRNELVARSDIVDRLWGKDVFVDVDTGVHTAIRKLRRALRDSVDTPAFIETVPGRGYRFIAPVEVGRPPDVVAASPSVPVALPAPVTSARRRSIAWPAAVAAAVVMALAVGLLSWTRRGDSADARITLAVLPFENLGSDPERQYLADGLTEETSASLAQIDPDRLSVKGRTLRYKRTTKTAAEIGRELSVDYLLESSLQSEQGRLRVTAKLIRVRDQEYVWTQTYDYEPASALGLQRELSAAIAKQIRLRLSVDRLDAVARRQTRSADAYDLYLRGRNFANQRTPATTKRAIDYYERATGVDPDYALAWAGLAAAYAASPVNGDAPPLEVTPRARDTAARALRADPDLVEAQYASAFVQWQFEWNWPAAEAGFRKAIALSPDHAWSHISLAHLLSQTGRHDEARATARRARELEPLEPMMHAMSSQMAAQARDYTAALEHAHQSVALDSEFWIGHIMKGQALLHLGQTDLALEELTTAARFSNQNSKAISFKGYLLARSGRTAEARDVLAALEGVSRTRYVPPVAIALVHAALGETDAAFEWLERAEKVRDVHLIFLTVDAKWDTLRADPRFPALLDRCGFTRATR